MLFLQILYKSKQITLYNLHNKNATTLEYQRVILIGTNVKATVLIFPMLTNFL